MKSLILALAVLLYAGTAFAQNTAIVDVTKTTVYVDSTLGGVPFTAVAQTAAAIARGFSGYTILPSINSANEAYIQWRWRGKTSGTLAAATSFTQDTVRLQGLIGSKAGANKLDSIWVDIPLTWKISGTSGPQAVVALRDTSATVFFPGTPGMGNANGYISPRFALPKGYNALRVVNGVVDSGRVFIRTTLEQVIK
jgi:hypothetical protein